MTDLGRRIGQRTNLSPANNASWLLAVAILAIVIPANDKIASNLVFFAAHDVSPIAWAVVLVVGLVVFWAVLARANCRAAARARKPSAGRSSGAKSVIGRASVPRK